MATLVKTFRDALDSKVEALRDHVGIDLPLVRGKVEHLVANFSKELERLHLQAATKSLQEKEFKEHKQQKAYEAELALQDQGKTLQQAVGDLVKESLAKSNLKPKPTLKPNKGKGKAKSSAHPGKKLDNKKLKAFKAKAKSKPTMKKSKTTSKGNWSVPRNFNIAKVSTYPEDFFISSLRERTTFLARHSSLEYIESKSFNDKVHNLTSKEIPLPIQRIISFNMKFIPTPKPAKQAWETSYADFVRRIRWMYALRRKEKINKDFNRKLHIRSDREGPTGNKTLEKGILKGYSILESIFNKKVIRPPPKLQSLVTLESFLKEGDSLILPTDKNMGMAVVSVEWYVAEALRQLSDENVYTVVGEPTWTEDSNWTVETINELGECLSPQERKWLLNRTKTSSTLPYFKLLPKVHKSPVLGRPIVPSFDTFYTNASIWVAEQLKVLIPEYTWILKDPTSFLQTLPMEFTSVGLLGLDDDIWLISGDVEAMYPSIPTEWGLQRIESVLQRTSLPLSTKTLVLRLLEKILTRNFFSFLDKTYLQVRGTAMGTPCAPLYANLVMADIEFTGINRRTNIQGLELKYYGRYLDDIFVVIKGGDTSPSTFIELFQREHNSFKFTWNVSKVSMTFLDVNIKTERMLTVVKLETQTYQKPMNAYQYIPWSSYHPLHAKKGWIKAELLRHVRNNSNLNDFLEIRKKFYMRLRARGYPHRFLVQVFNQVDYQSCRPLALKAKATNITTGKDLGRHVIFKSTYNPIWDGTNLNSIWEEVLLTWRELDFLPIDTKVIHSQSRPNTLGDMFNRQNNKTIQRYKDMNRAHVIPAP